mmetsp:Transcript_23008/g.53369  ORF Transcript_23008/g.53369 Transcript_23008/m.53369 type:complete len:298 (-) Transcript_23008:236-1129(-)
MLSANSKLAWHIRERNWDAATARLWTHASRGEVRQECSLSMSGSLHGAFPLHLACSMRPLPPASFVRQLLLLYPEAVSIAEKMWGFLPLHLACSLTPWWSSSSSLNGDLFPALGCGGSSYFSSSDDDSSFDSCPFDEVMSDASSADVHGKAMFNDQTQIIEMLVKADPWTVRVPEHFGGMLPIHIVAATTSSRLGTLYESELVVMNLLLDRYPESVHVLDARGDTPSTLAAREVVLKCPCCYDSMGLVDEEQGKECPHVEHSPRLNPLLLKSREQMFDLDLTSLQTDRYVRSMMPQQ